VTRRSEATRRRLIAAARELIATQGADISLTEVAERAGVTRMTLYRHFGPRRELLLEVLLDELTPMASTAGAILADRSLPLTSRAHQAMVLVTVTVSSTPLLLTVLGDGVDGLDLEDIDPSDTVGGLLTAHVRPFLEEAEAAGLLRSSIEEAQAWVSRQVLAGVVGRGGQRERAVVARQTALFFVPSLLRVSDEECRQLANTERHDHNRAEARILPADA